jgi:thiamine biosynthesis lipoprotein
VIRAAALAALCLAAGGAAGSSVSDGRYVMGTVLEITVAGDPAVLEELFDLAAELDTRFTVYAESPVVELNRRAGAGPVPVPPEVTAILRDSIAFSRLTGGAFDVTVGPLVELWTDAARRNRLPAAGELAAARARVGSDKIRLDRDTAELGAPGMALNLGGVAKGWALDRMAERLRARGVTSALLDFGGSSQLAIGAPEGEPGFRLLLHGARDDYAGTLLLRDRALSVSGSLGQWSEIAGRRYGHVIDPRSGEPLTVARQAAVVATSAALAEALSKALLVLGPERGLALIASQPGALAVLIEADGSRIASPGFDHAVGFVPAVRGSRDPR